MRWPRIAAGDSRGVFRGLGHRTFEAAFRTVLDGDFAHDVAVADLNGDGIPDLATAGLASVDEVLVLETWLGSGTGAFAKRDWPSTP